MDNYKEKIYNFFKNADIGSVIGFGGACFVEKIDDNNFRQCFDWWSLKEGQIYDLDFIVDYYATATCFTNFLVKDKSYIEKVKRIDNELWNSPIRTMICVKANDGAYEDKIFKVSETEYAVPKFNILGYKKYDIVENYCLSDNYPVDEHVFEFKYN